MVSEATNIELQISILLATALIGYFIARRFGQSVVIGEMLIGIVVGPSLLGWVSYTPFVQSTATLGAIVLLFVIGLETKFKDIFTLNSFLIALGGVIVPWIAGYYTALFFGYSAPEAVFVGTALTATSIAITAHVLKELGKLDSQAAKVIIGAAVVDDVLGLLALSMTIGFAEQGVDWGIVGIIAAKAFVFLGAGVIVGVYFLAKELEKLNKWAEKNNAKNMTFIAAIALAFGYAVVAELVGLSGIVGAFIAGVSFESVKIRSYREGAEYLEVIFAAIFFVSLGILVDVGAAATAGAFLIVLSILAVLSKLAGCFVPAKLLGLSNKDSAIIGVGMVPRGEVAMIAALIGLNAKIIGAEVYSAILLMSLLTTIATPVLIKRLYAKKIAG